MRYVLPCLFLGMLLAVGGCGKPIGNVTGKVTYNGTALKGGKVTFVSEEKQVSPHFSDIDEEGNYKVDKVPAGEWILTVETDFLKGPKEGKRFNNAPPPGAQQPPGYKPKNPEELAKLYTEIPAKYKSPKESGLKCTVKGGNQEHNIDLPK